MPQPETQTYRVYLTQTVSTVVEVEATSPEEAEEASYSYAPSPTNSTNKGIDPSGVWEAVSVEDASGVEVLDLCKGK